MRVWLMALSLLAFVPALAVAEQAAVRVELNALEDTAKTCRPSFVVENKSAALESLKLDLVVFDTEGVIHRRTVVELGPMRAGRTMVKTYVFDTSCARIGAVLVNDVTACAPGEVNACLDGLTLSSRVKTVRFYK